MSSFPTARKPPGPFPVPNATVPYWRTEPHALDTYRSTLDLPDLSDVIIVGAGFAGVTAAYYLLTDDASERPSVTLLEAREACSGATGRNGKPRGHLRPDYILDVAERAASHGVEFANELALFEVANAEAVKDLIRKEGIACELHECTTGYAFLDEVVAAELKKQYDELIELDCPTVKEVKYYGPSDAEDVTAVKGAKAAFTFPAATLWPYKMVLGVLERAVQGGLNLQTETPVLQVSETPDSEGYWTLTTPRGTTRAKQVIIATNAYTAGILPEYASHIIPIRGMCGRVKPMSPKPASAPQMLHSSATEYVSFGHDYHGTQPDGSFVVGGTFAPLRKHATRYGVVDDASLYDPELVEGVFEGWLQQSFKGWENVKTKVQETWTGIFGSTSDRLPHIGRVPGRPGMFICAGFNGHGMPNVLLCSKAVVQMMQTGCAFAETGVPTGYETSTERLAAPGEVMNA
ncbi:uncharacterized protein JN550_011842 [Neoarthrinium moseri]|uniref:uncharacterized protein n=1 Tax=Neoarthrinium moseri TaxID=1658444 RepID=UPI001FDBE98F|nr:uncharacterized protein JN550_011842 [Neoarthrinium moseri]KAI1859923.1 hypothetical protein JN550_011842 [Neoarthrinium moseri]